MEAKPRIDEDGVPYCGGDQPCLMTVKGRRGPIVVCGVYEETPGRADLAHMLPPTGFCPYGVSALAADAAKGREAVRALEWAGDHGIEWHRDLANRDTRGSVNYLTGSGSPTRREKGGRNLLDAVLAAMEVDHV